MTVRLNLTQLRKQRGYTQTKLGKVLGLTLKGFQHLEYCATSIKLETLDKLCHELDCTPADLLSFDRNECAGGSIRVDWGPSKGYPPNLP